MVKRITEFIRNHPLLTYVVLTFAISWGSLLILAGPGGFPGTPESTASLLPFAVLAIVAGPSVAGILVTGIVHERAGLREMRFRLGIWRVRARWYAVALLTAPVLMATILLALSLISPAFLPGIITSADTASFVLLGIFIAAAAGFFEELGWTGFATPELRKKYGVFATGFIIGLVWAVWHLLFAYWFSGTVSGPLSLASYLLDPFLYLLPFRVLMVWVYDRTGSLLVAALMHGSLTASARILTPQAFAGVPLMTFDLAWTAVLWGIIAVIAVAGGGRFPRPESRGLRT
jgi:membrane protease YdiL (CAAX protease family)